MPCYRITAVAVYESYLVLNPMMGNTEGQAKFGPFVTREAALAFYNQYKVDHYTDEGPNTFDGGTKMYTKSFAKGSPLEWMNPLNSFEMDSPGYHGHGIHEVLADVVDIVRTSGPF